MISDEDILKEGRMPAAREVLLYNISLRQDDMRTQSTDLLLSKVQDDPAYQEMIERGLLTYEVYDHGRTPVAHLRVTLKGLRYCVLHAEEIEPMRTFDTRGTLRKGRAKMDGEESNPALVHSVMSFNSMPERGEIMALRQGLIDHYGDVQAERTRAKRDLQEREKERRSAPRDFTTDTGDIWTYQLVDGVSARIVGVAPSGTSLSIPADIDGAPVTTLADQALAGLRAVEEIVCPNSIVSIGEGAFRGNPRLKRLLLPQDLDQFKAGWISQCPKLEELALPGMVEEIAHDVLASDRLHTLYLGRGTHSIVPGTFRGSHLVKISIDAANPFLSTDGTAIYTKDNAELLALACPIEHLEVRPGCRRIAKRCCHGFTSLTEVMLPDSIEEIGPFAFSGTALASFEAPRSLRSVGEKAFLNCKALKHIKLNDGLRVIDDAAFQGSGLEALSIPASIEHIGTSITSGTAIVHSGPHRTLTIDARSKLHFFDGNGGLYRREEDGVHLVQLVDPEIRSYEVFDGTTVVDASAFACNERIEEVRMAPSVRVIGPSAFRSCHNLRHVELSDGIRSIGKEAFFDTSLEKFRVPAQLEELGARALVTYGAHFGGKIPSLSHVEVAPGNETFYVSCGMLCQRKGGESRVIVFTSSEEHVVFPEDVTRVEEYAFSNARGVDYLSLDPNLVSVGSKGLATRCWIRHIRIELPVPLEGRRVFDYHFPNSPESIRGIALGLGNSVSVSGLFEQLDLCLVTAHNYNAAREVSQVSPYEQARLILERLNDPVMLSASSRAALEKVLDDHVTEICVDATLHDDRLVFEQLLDRSVVNASNLDEIIERVTALRDAATSAFLLEAKRVRFSSDAFDYDL
jgi:hypothetical protein